ncbi:MAG: SDR family oxidoreductase [Methylotenera sp.]|nr:SDR family oxidoreductase [Methylotenera sp.]
MTQTILITGANRGLGLEFTKQYATDGWQVLACCRHPQSALALQALAEKQSHIRVLALDVGDFKQIDALSLSLQHEHIDVLINNAGVYPASSFGDTDEAAWAQAFKINSMAPLKMAEAFIAQLMRGKHKVIATLSSKMGSIDDNGSGGEYLYRSSKTAVNMIMKSLSIDVKPHGISVVTLHPGWVRTEMGGPNGLIDATESVQGLRKVIAQQNLSNSGKFITYDGKEVAW